MLSDPRHEPVERILRVILHTRRLRWQAKWYEVYVPAGAGWRLLSYILSGVTACSYRVLVFSPTPGV